MLFFPLKLRCEYSSILCDIFSSHCMYVTKNTTLFLKLEEIILHYKV